MMSTKQGFVQGYNAQAVANAEQVIVAVAVTDEHNDAAQPLCRHPQHAQQLDPAHWEARTATG